MSRNPKVLTVPMNVSAMSLNDNDFQTVIMSDFEGYGFRLPICFTSVNGEIVSREGEKFVSSELMESKEFKNYLKSVAERDCVETPQWFVRLDANPIYGHVTIFTITVIWSEGSETELGSFTVLEKTGDVPNYEHDLVVTTSNRLMDLVAPYEERYGKFKIFLKKLLDG